MRNSQRLVILLVLVVFAVGLSGCAWGGVSGVAALVVALLLGLGVGGCHQRSIGADDDAGTTACDQGACPEFMACVTVSGDFWCLPDVDGDGVPDAEDNCVWLANPDQQDTEGDGWGDACDLFPEEDNMLSPCGPWCMVDSDGDGIAGMLDGDSPHPMGEDNCPILYNPDQADADGDGVGDLCDLCPEFNTPSPCGDPCLDSDGDGISDWDFCAGGESDACVGTPSAGSDDYDGDDLPDVCDPDGIPPIATREDYRRALLERLGREGVLEAGTVRTALS